jgi:lysophospholipase L1-like esterase
MLATNSQGTALGVAAGASYPELVRDALAPQHDVSIAAESGWSIRDFNAAVDRLLTPVPDLVVVQIGIVECSRRILSTFEKRVLARVPRSAKLTKFLHNRRQAVVLLRNRLHLDTRLFGLREFNDEVAQFAAGIAAAGVDLMILEIPRFGDDYERRYFPLINEDIELFNAVLRRHGAVPFVTPDDSGDEIWQAGTVHFSRRGHELAAARLADLIVPRLRTGAIR